MQIDKHIAMRYMSRPIRLGLVLSVVPVLIWSGMYPFATRWAGGYAALRSLSQLTGLIGMVLFAYTLAISARFRWMESWMGPLNQIYTAHHILGVFALVFLLLHPIFAITHALLVKAPSLARFVLPGLDNALSWGILSLWVLVILMMLTLYIRPRYPLWRKTHRFLGLALFLAGLHGLYISSDISTSLALRVYMFVVTGMSLILFMAYTIFNRLTVKRYRYHVDKVERLSENVVTVFLVPKGKPLFSEPGRFIFASFLIDGRWSESHPFSLTSSDETGRLSFSMKVLGDDTARFADRVIKGVSARLEGPFGSFGEEMAEAHRSICVAGGIGVTPFLPLLSSLHDGSAADIYYCVKKGNEAPHLASLISLEENSGGRLHVIPWYSEAQGYLSISDIDERSRLTPEDHLFLCGPPSMMRALRLQARRIGISDSHIHSEEFSLQ